MFKNFNEIFARLTAIEEKLGVEAASLSLEKESANTEEGDA